MNIDNEIKAINEIQGLMNELARRYTADEMHELWMAMDVMRARYGNVFVAAAIHKDRSAAEVALFRYIKTLEREKEQEFEDDQEEYEVDPADNWHRIDPRPRKSLWKKLAALFAVLVFGVAITAFAMGAAAVDRSDAFIEWLDAR